MRFLVIASLLALTPLATAQTGDNGLPSLRAPVLTVNGSGFGAPSCTTVSGPWSPAGQFVALTLFTNIPDAGVIIGAADSCQTPGTFTGTLNTFDLDYSSLAWVVDGSGSGLLGPSSVLSTYARTNSLGIYGVGALVTTPAPGPWLSFQAAVIDPSQPFGVDLSQALEVAFRARRR